MSPARSARRGAASLSLGVDRGGTWLRVAAVDGRGRLLWRERWPTAPLALLARVLAGLLRRRGVRRAARLTVGSKGVWTRGERAKWRRAWGPLARRVTVLSDVELALEAVLPRGRPGVVLIAGTGSIALGRDARGRLARAGGLGPRRGDEGSGYWIGREMIRRRGGRRERRLLWRYDAAGVAAVAARAKEALSRARRDTVSAEITARAQVCLAGLLRRVVERLRLRGRVTVGLGGGLMADIDFRKGVRRVLRSAAPGRRFMFKILRGDLAFAAARRRPSEAAGRPPAIGRASPPAGRL